MSQSQFNVMPRTLTVRELSVGGKILVTTMCCPNTVSRKALKHLYKSRWHVELDIRHIKTTMGMEALSCLTPQMAYKELWIYLLAYNLIRLIMIQSALLKDILPRQLSFRHTVQLWLSYKQQVGDREFDGKLRQGLLILVGQQTVGNRPERVEPRALKRRRKPYSMLNKPRQLLRQEFIQKWA